MDKEMKILLRNNVIKFIIGTILLIISYGYIQNHPAEKASIFSGFEVLWQRTEVMLYKIFHKDSEALKTKFELEKTFEELINSTTTRGCVDSAFVESIHEVLSQLKKEKLSNLSNTIFYYRRQIGEFKNHIDKTCK